MLESSSSSVKKKRLNRFFLFNFIYHSIHVNKYFVLKTQRIGIEISIFHLRIFTHPEFLSKITFPKRCFSYNCIRMYVRTRVVLKWISLLPLLFHPKRYIIHVTRAASKRSSRLRQSCFGRKCNFCSRC